MSVAGIFVVEFGPFTGRQQDVVGPTTNLTSYGHVVQHLQLVLSLSVGGVV